MTGKKQEQQIYGHPGIVCSAAHLIFGVVLIERFHCLYVNVASYLVLFLYNFPEQNLNIWTVDG